MSPRLRGYQKRTVRDVKVAWTRSRSVLLQEFPGAGKTHENVAIVRGYVAAKKCVLYLVHRGEILKQTRKKLESVGLSASVGVVWGDRESDPSLPVQLASVPTLARRGKPEGPDFDLVVVDEAHHAQAESWRKILGWYPNAKVLGSTATPERLDGKPLREFFEEMVLGEPCESLIEAGYLVRPEVWTRDDAWRPEGLRKSGADYALDEAARSMMGPTIVGGIPTSYLARAAGLPAVGFAATKKQAEGLVEAFLAAGVPSETLFGDHSEEERDAILARLEAGETRVVWTCDVLGEGWDYPGARCAILARPTASLARYVQWCGRVMRAGSRAVILDHAGNYAVHGPPWEERAWSLDGRPEPTKRVAQVDGEGRVTFLEPIEVDGRLVRADYVVRQEFCAGWDGKACGKRAPRDAACRSRVAGRRGEPWRCKSCGIRRAKSLMTPEQRSKLSREARERYAAMSPEQQKELVRKAVAGLPPERRAETVRKVQGSKTPEQRSASARARHAAMTPEQRSEITRKGSIKRLATMTPELRRAAGIKSNASKTPEQRRNAGIKSNTTRKIKRLGGGAMCDACFGYVPEGAFPAHSPGVEFTVPCCGAKYAFSDAVGESRPVSPEPEAASGER